MLLRRSFCRVVSICNKLPPISINSNVVLPDFHKHCYIPHRNKLPVGFKVFHNSTLILPTLISDIVPINAPVKDPSFIIEKHGRVGGKYKRPRFKRRQVKRKHKKKRLRLNRNKIRKKRIAKTMRKLKQWKEGLNVLENKEKLIRLQINKHKESQSDLVRQINQFQREFSERIEELRKNNKDFDDKFTVLDEVDRVASDFDETISKLYRRRKN